MPALTISAAARLCGVDRRTLQRAIHAGRLHLDAAHCLETEELLLSGYLVMDEPQALPQLSPQHVPHDTPQWTPQNTPQYLPQLPPLAPPQGTVPLALLERLATVLEALYHEVHVLRTARHVASQDTPHDTPRFLPHDTPQDTPQSLPPPAPQGTPQGTPRRRQGGQAFPTPHAFDATKYVLGKLCKRQHAYEDTGQTLRLVHNSACPLCKSIDQRARRAARRQED